MTLDILFIAQLILSLLVSSIVFSLLMHQLRTKHHFEYKTLKKSMFSYFLLYTITNIMFVAIYFNMIRKIHKHDAITPMKAQIYYECHENLTFDILS